MKTISMRLMVWVALSVLLITPCSSPASTPEPPTPTPVPSGMVDSTWIHAARAGHDIPREEPELVIEAIRKLVAESGN